MAKTKSSRIVWTVNLKPSNSSNFKNGFSLDSYEIEAGKFKKTPPSYLAQDSSIQFALVSISAGRASKGWVAYRSNDFGVIIKFHFHCSPTINLRHSVTFEIPEGINDGKNPFKSTMDIGYPKFELVDEDLFGEDKKGNVVSTSIEYLGDSAHEGDLLREKGGRGHVYLISGGIRRWIPDPDTLHGLGYSFSGVKNVSKDDMESFPEGPQIPSWKNGNLYKASRPHTYIMENKKRRWITGSAVFQRMGLKSGDVQRISDNDLNQIPEGENIT